jgi:hypothetical protein
MNAAKKPDEQDSNRDACQNSNEKPRCICKPHPLQDVDHLIQRQASIMLSETVVVANSYKGLRDSVTDLIEDYY